MERGGGREKRKEGAGREKMRRRVMAEAEGGRRKERGEREETCALCVPDLRRIGGRKREMVVVQSE